MQALRKVDRGRGHVSVQDVQEPTLERDEVLMRVWAAGICGSDLLIQDDKHFYEAPVTLGHEFSGVVEAVGPDVHEVRVGQKIVADIETRTGWLGVTRDGAFAPHMSVPEAQVHVCPDHVSLDHACFAEPVVAILHAMQERNTVNAADTVVVVGPGPMGLLGVQFAKLRGASQVILIGLRDDEQRLAIGRDVGADVVLYSEEHPEATVMDLTDGRGADFVLECSASGTGVQHAIDCARRSPEGRGGRGVVSFISLWGEPITIQPDAISLGQLSIQGAWSWNGPETWRRAVDLISRGVFDLDALITNRYDLTQWEDAFESLRSRRDVKAFFQPNGTDWS